MSVGVRSTSVVDAHKGYEVWRRCREAVKALNTLQSNAQTIEKMRKEKDARSHLNIPRMVKFAERTGVTLDDIDKLNIIHVSGTKGKGSTCAFCESILRHHGYRTGFFSSPHLVEVRERFRINGQPISREKFATYFWEVYNKLLESKDHDDSGMPAYFAFLTVMAFSVFRQEKVDVAIMEVGIGGQYDSTNLIRKPVVCGVTSLGLDHVSILGDTVEKIAWHKAGIFKHGVAAVSSPQPEGALKVLQSRAAEIGSPFHMASSLSTFEEDGPLHLGISGHKQRSNASLAIELCKIFMQSKIAQRGHGDSVANDDKVLKSKGVLDQGCLHCSTKQGLEECTWPGRTQVIKRPGLTYFLDGAHTVESIQQCVDWFLEASEKDIQENKCKDSFGKVIVFNTTGDRDPSLLIEPLMVCNFDAAVFCPNLGHISSTSADTTNLTISKESQLNRVLLNMHAWERVMAKTKLHQGTNTVAPRSVQCNMNHISTKTTDTLRYHDQEDQLCNEPEPKIARSDPHLPRSAHSCSAIQSDFVCDNDSVTVTREFSNIYTALQWATQGRELSLDTEIDLDDEIPDQLRDVKHIQVLVTGSLHLVGGVLGVVGISDN